MSNRIFSLGYARFSVKEAMFFSVSSVCAGKDFINSRCAFH